MTAPAPPRDVQGRRVDADPPSRSRWLPASEPLAPQRRQRRERPLSHALIITRTGATDGPPLGWPLAKER